MTGAGARFAELGTNIPASKLSGGGWYVINNAMTSTGYTGYAWPGTYHGLRYHFGAVQTGDITEEPNLTPAETWNIDTKIDDGKPAIGRMTSYRSRVNCATNDNDSATAEYNLSFEDVACHFIIMN